jgi:hypothetical protein
MHKVDLRNVMYFVLDVNTSFFLCFKAYIIIIGSCYYTLVCCAAVVAFHGIAVTRLCQRRHAWWCAGLLDGRKTPVPEATRMAGSRTGTACGGHAGANLGRQTARSSVLPLITTTGYVVMTPADRWSTSLRLVGAPHLRESMVLASFDDGTKDDKRRAPRQLPWCVTHPCLQCQSPPGSQAVATGGCLRAPSCCRQPSSRGK